MTLWPGDAAGTLLIERELGRGAFGVVYLARDQLLGRSVALKILPGEAVGASPENREKILQEARIVAGVQSAHVVTLYRIHESPDGGLWLEMEYVSGGSLEEVLAERLVLPVDEAVRAFRGICRGLDAAHESRVFHGDIKPANLLFDAKGRIKLTDFGLSRMLEGKRSSIDLMGQALGSPLYMAPEVITGEQAGISSDLWSAGVVFYEMLSGRTPFTARTLPELIARLLMEEVPPLPAEIPAGLRNLVSRCLSRDLADRPVSARAILDLLAAGGDELLDTIDTGEVDVRTNLRAAQASFVGREKEITELGALLTTESTTLVTLTGPGGIGKTRLSQEVGRKLLRNFKGGVYFVDLSEVTDVAGIAHAVAEALSLPPGGEGKPIESVAAALEYRDPTLLILDNFEQIISGGPATVGAWRSRAGHVKFLITSRALLSLRGERAFELLPLAAETSDQDGRDEAAVRALPAVRLFIERAAGVNPAFDPDRDELDQILTIVRELDGIPLAIELAAARARIMKPAQIARNLERRFQLLRSTESGVAERQKTLLGAIDWSYELLTPHEKAAFLQTSFFRDGFSLEAAEAVIDLSPWPDAPLAMDVVQSLRDKSLLVARDAGTEIRLALYRSIREFGQRRREEDFDPARQRALAERHAGFHLAMAEEQNARIPGRRAAEALDLITAELANLDLATEWFLSCGDGERAARVVLAAAETMLVRRAPVFLIERLCRLDPVFRELPPTLRARLLAARTAVCQESGDWERALTCSAEAVAAGRASGQDAALLIALAERAGILRWRAEFDEALAAYQECEELSQLLLNQAARARAIVGRGMILGVRVGLDPAHDCFLQAEVLAGQAGDGQTLALCLHNRGVVYERWGRRDDALACYREEEDVSRRLGYRLRVAVSLGAQGNVHSQAGDLDSALSCYLEGEKIARELGARQRLSYLLSYRGALHKMRGDLDRALSCYEEGLAISRELRDRRQVAVFLGQLGSACSARHDLARAVDCYAEAEAVAEAIGDRLVLARNTCNRGALLRELGRHDEALAALERGLGICDEMHAGESVWYFAFSGLLAELAGAAGDHARARELAENGVALAGKLGITGAHPEEDVRNARALFLRILAE